MINSLPTAPGSVICIDGGFLMLTSFGNWVTEGLFALSEEEVRDEQFMVFFDAADGSQVAA